MLTQARLVVLVALLAASSMFLGACATAEKAAPGEQAAPEAKEGAPKRGGILTRAAGASSFSGTDPSMGQASYSVWPVMGGAMVLREPTTFELLPEVLESWQFSKDGKELTLHVRKGIKFHNKPPVNGREVEARDIVYTLKGITGQLYPDLASVRFPRRSNLEQMVDAVALDRYTVKVTLSETSSTFLDGMADYRATWVIPDGIREHFGDIQSLTEPSVEAYISAGPFILEKFSQLVEVQYKRNPEYWEKGKPYLDGVQEVWIPDRSTELAAFVAGQIDYTAATVETDRSFITANRKDAVLHGYGPGSCWYRLAFNLERKPFDDYRVRRAIALIVDQKKLGEQLRGGWEGKPLWKYPGPLPWVFPDSLSQEELAAMDLYKGPTPENVVEAQRLLKEAGYGNGFSTEMIGAKTPPRPDEAQLIVADLEKYLPGVKIRINLMDNAIQQNRAAKGDFEVQLYCYIHEFTSVGMMKTAYHTKGGRNYSRFSDAKMDELLDKAAAELDPDKRKELLRQAQFRAFETISMWPTYHGQAIEALQPYLKGTRLGGGNTTTAWLKEWWLDK